MQFDPSQPSEDLPPKKLPIFDPSQESEDLPPQPGAQFDPSRPSEDLSEEAPGWIAQRVNELKRGGRQLGQMLDVAQAQIATEVEEKARRRAENPEAAVHPLDRLVGKIVPAAMARDYQATPEAVAEAARRDIADAQRMRTAAAQSLAINTAEAAKLPRSRAMQDFDDAKGLGGALTALARHPIAAPVDLTLNSLPSSAGGMAMGALLGSEAGPGGTAAGTFLGSLAPEYAGKIQEVAQSMGVDLRDPKQIEAFFADPQKMATATQLALRKGVPIAALDAATAGFAGRFLKPALGQGVRKVALATAKETAMQAAGAAGGETLGELAAGETLSPKDILAEVVADLPSAVQETTTNLLHERGNRPTPPRPAQNSPTEQPVENGETGAVQQGRTAPNPEPPQNLDAVLGRVMQAEEKARAEQAAAEAARAEQQAQAEQRATAYAQQIARAEEVAAKPDATFAEVEGALSALNYYAEDNSLRVAPEQQAAAARAVEALAQAREKLKPAEEARQANAQQQTQAEEQRRAAAAKAEQERLRQIERTGRDADGQIVDLRKVPQAELERIAELQDHEAEGLAPQEVDAELMRRAQAAEKNEATRTEAGNDLLAVLHQVKLPANDQALGVELRQLIEEGMSVKDRGRYVSNTKAGGLDSLAEQLRADHGFTQLQTPSDVIDAVHRALRGEQVLPARQPDFARPLPPGSRVTVRQPEPHPLAPGRMIPGFQQIDFPQNSRSAAPDELRAEDWTLPENFERLPTGSYELDAEGQLAAVNFARRKGKTSGLSEARRAEIWKTVKHAFGKLGTEVDIEIAATKQAYLDWFARNVPNADLASATDTEAARVPAQIRADLDAAMAKRDAIVFAAEAWRTAKRGVSRLLHEAAHAYWHTLPKEVQAALTEEHHRQVAAAMQLREIAAGTLQATPEEIAHLREVAGPLFDQTGQSRSDLEGVDDLSPWGTREWFAEMTMWQNRKWGRRRYAMASKLTGRARLLIEDAVHGFTELVRRVVGGLVQSAGHDFSTDFWQNRFRDFVTGGARASERTASVATAYARQRQAEFATPSPDWRAQAGKELAIVTAPADAPRSAAQAMHWWKTSGPRTVHLDGAPVTVSGSTIGKIVAGGKPFPRERMAMVTRLQELVAQGIRFDRADDGRDPDVRQIAEIYTPFRIDGRTYRARTLIKFFTEPSGRADKLHSARLEDLVVEKENARLEKSGGDAHAVPPPASPGKMTVGQLFAAVNPSIDFATPRPEDAEPVGELVSKSLPPRDSKEALLGLVADAERARARIESEGGSVAAYDTWSARIRELRAELDQRFPGWRQKTETAPTATAEPAAEHPEDAEASPFNAAEPRPEDAPAPAVTAQKVRALEGQSAIEPAWHTRAWAKTAELLRNWKGPLPELPTFPNAWWNRKDPFLQTNAEFYNPLKLGYRAAQRLDGPVRRLAEDRLAAVVQPLFEAARKAGRKFSAKEYQRLQQLQARIAQTEGRGKPVDKRLVAEVAALQTRLENDPYVQFSRLVMYLDLDWRAKNLRTPNGEPINLPMGLTAAEVAQRLDTLKTEVAAAPWAGDVATALQRHVDLVAEVAKDLEQRELLPMETLKNPFYFPHLILTKTGHDATGRVIQEARQLSLEKVRAETGEAFRGYLLDPVGSTRAIETDYAKAMFYHLVQVGAHNAMADVRDQYFKPYDIRDEVARRAKQLSRQRGVPVSWRQAFEEEFKNRGYVVMTADIGRNLMPAVTIDRKKLAERIGHMIGEGDIRTELEKLDIHGIKILPEDVRESLMAGEKEQWVVPARVAEAIAGMERREKKKDNPLENALGAYVAVWKRLMLFAPHNYLRYEFNNRVADLEKLFSADPAAFRMLPRAYREVHAFIANSDPAKITAEVRAAFRNGVVGGITADQVNALPELTKLADLATDGQRFWTWIKAHNTIAASRLNESAFRYAKFLADLERMRNGAAPVYAGAYWRDIEAIRQGDRPEQTRLVQQIAALEEEIEDRHRQAAALQGAARTEATAANARAGTKLAELRRQLETLPDDRDLLAAAEISNKSFGDYSDTSVNGQWIRAKLAPFWSWTEVNFKYHANMLRNFRDAVLARDMAAADAARIKDVARSAAVFGFTLSRKGAALFLTRLALPYLCVAAWNNHDDDYEEMEKELSAEDRRRFHILLGRDAEGKPSVLYLPTAFSDIAKWFGGPEFARLATQYLNGSTSLADAMTEWTDSLLPDAINNVAGQLGPAVKVPYVIASKKNPFPDVTDQRTIPAYDMRRAIIAQMTDGFVATMIERAVNKDYVDPRTMAGWAKQLILQARSRDPESWAFYAIKDKANDFVEKRTGRSRTAGDFDAPEAQVLRNFRRAIYRGDIEVATKMYQQLLAYGYTAERFQASIRSQHPLSTIPKELRREFVENLDPYDRGLLERALRYYTRMNTLRHDERRLFPRAGRNERQTQILRERFPARPELLAAEIQRREDMPEEEIRRRASLALREATRR